MLSCFHYSLIFIIYYSLRSHWDWQLFQSCFSYFRIRLFESSIVLLRISLIATASIYDIFLANVLGMNRLFIFRTYLCSRQIWKASLHSIPNGCFDAYDVKVNKDIFQCQEKVKLISQFQRCFKFFNELLVFASFP